jgi:hypothetical protein
MEALLKHADARREAIFAKTKTGVVAGMLCQQLESRDGTRYPLQQSPAKFPDFEFQV